MKILKINLSINTILSLVLIYPLILLFPSLLGYQAFFLTSPYFFLVFIFLVFILIIKKKIPYFKLLPIIISLLVISIINFSSLRYSLPIFYLAFIILVMFFLKKVNTTINMKSIPFFFLIYIVCSIPFLFLENGQEVTGRFVGFIGSPTVYAGVITTLYILVSKGWVVKSYKFIISTIIVFSLVYLTKTRLILIFILISPFLKYFLENKIFFSLKKVFLIFLITIMSIYPLYEQVVKTFPSLVTLRYEDNRDASFGLRYFVYKKLITEYSEGSFTEKTFGKGNEYSRTYIKDLFQFDLMPHNDFIRILIDWGLIGLLMFIGFLYKISTKNKETCFLSIVYMLLFYSNMIFNFFLISILIIFYFADKDD